MWIALSTTSAPIPFSPQTSAPLWQGTRRIQQWVGRRPQYPQWEPRAPQDPQKSPELQGMWVKKGRGAGTAVPDGCRFSFSHLQRAWRGWCRKPLRALGRAQLLLAVPGLRELAAARTTARMGTQHPTRAANTCPGHPGAAGAGTDALLLLLLCPALATEPHGDPRDREESGRSTEGWDHGTRGASSQLFTRAVTWKRDQT